jgi:hypothetical protein
LNNKITKKEKEYLMLIKLMPCGVCGQHGPSDAHHVTQGLQYTCIPLCKSCHQDNHNGIHGRKAIWNVLKKTEDSVLNDTIGYLFENGHLEVK